MYLAVFQAGKLEKAMEMFSDLRQFDEAKKWAEEYSRTRGENAQVGYWGWGYWGGGRVEGWWWWWWGGMQWRAGRGNAQVGGRLLGWWRGGRHGVEGWGWKGSGMQWRTHKWGRLDWLKMRRLLPKQQGMASAVIPMLNDNPLVSRLLVVSGD